MRCILTEKYQDFMCTKQFAAPCIFTNFKASGNKKDQPKEKTQASVLSEGHKEPQSLKNDLLVRL